MSERNLAPYFLAIGPLLLVGAYMNWPAADAIGIRGTQSLIGEADSLMPLLIAATLGTLLVLGGLYLLIADMMANTTGDNALVREMRRMFSILPDKQNQFTKALLTNNPSDFINFAEKRLPSQTEINEFHQLIQDWNGYYTNTQNR